MKYKKEGFYEKLLAGADVSTSQPSIHYVASIWDELLEEYDEVVYIPMSSGLSESCRAAMLFAEQHYSGKVFVVDNQRISITQRQSVLDAMELVEKGYTGSQIKKILEEQKMNSDIFIMVDTLKYLKKGGRITPAAAALGGALKIKPILRIKGEKLDKYHMMNRTVPNAKRIMINAVIECIQTNLKDLDGRTDNVHIEVTYSGVDKTNVNDLVEQVKEAFPNKEIYVAPLSLSVSCHIGDGAIAVACSKEIIL